MDLNDMCTNFVKLSSNNRLCIFDFDNTLFNSPEKPEGWTRGWWGRPESLLPPHVPVDPGPEFWIPDTVNAAKAASSSHSIMMTGRHPGFEKRINHLLNSIGLQFDEKFFCSGEDTLSFKKHKIIEFVKRLNPDFVEVWEDREIHIVAFKELLNNLGVNYKVHFVG